MSDHLGVKPLARCPASGSIGKALNRASVVLLREFRTRKDVGPFIGDQKTCEQMRGGWNEWSRNFLKGLRQKRLVPRRRAYWAIKSCNRLFDPPCKPCDKKSSNQAREQWTLRVSAEVTHEVGQSTFWSANPIETLKARVRELVGSQWAEKLERKRETCYVPDQQGCLENKRNAGGTFGVSPSEYSRKPNIVRVGVAKTKGKHRVVTMQGALTKRILTPIHETLYDHISSFGWCVRGDVTNCDFETIAEDCRLGEKYVSGDYSGATDNIYLEAVEAIIDVLCESKHLTAIEKEFLYKSFHDLRWQSLSGKLHPIKRGSMMGNLVSFPLLCLLNKACYDICRDFEEYWGDGEKGRKVRINGDDIMFCGTRRFVRLWESVVGHFGLIVNREKTDESGRFIELNSRTYDALRRRMVGKPVLSFLATKETTGDLIPEILKGMASFSHDNLMFVINDLLRYEISIRSISLGAIPDGLFNSLIKRKWFRVALQLGPLPVRVIGVPREIPTLVGPPPKPQFYDLVAGMCEDVTVDFVVEWLGQKVTPAETRIDRRSALSRRDLAKRKFPRFVTRGDRIWAYTWPAEVYRFFEDRFDFIFDKDNKDTWKDDDLRLTTRRSLIVSDRLISGLPLPRKTFPPPLSLLNDTVISGFVRYPGQEEKFVSLE